MGGEQGGPQAVTAPLCIDLYCGLGGWAEGFLAEGCRVVGFDIERWPYPGQFVLQDVRTLHGAQFKHATIIVASPPCNEYSYRAMPWKRAKSLPPPSNELFDACFRIQREASEAAGHKIPLIVENVCGAQKWVGRAKWHYGSYYLWGDIPALMPITFQRKIAGFRFDGSGKSFQSAAVKSTGMNWSNYGKPGYGGEDFTRIAAKQRQDACAESIKQGGEWWHDQNGLQRFGSRSVARKQASALIAKIPFPLANFIARVYDPRKGGHI